MIYRFNENPIRILQVIFTDIYKLILKSIQENSKHNIEGRTMLKKGRLPDFKTSYEASSSQGNVFWKD